MSLVKLGDYIELSDERNASGYYTVSDVRGLSIEKKFIDTKADMDGVNLKSYLVVSPKDFAYVTVTSRNGEKITLAYNSTNETYIVSSSYIVFHVKDTEDLLPEYLFMVFNRSEFDRYARFNSWGSARETFSWDEMCNITLELPSLDIQQKYVNIYKTMVANLKAYERGLEDLKLTCDGYIDQFKKEATWHKLKNYIELVSEKNSDLKYLADSVKGVNTEKQFIPTKADLSARDLTKFQIIRPGCFVFNHRTSRNGSKFSIAYNNEDSVFICTEDYVIFRVKDSCKDKLIPLWLYIYFARPEFDRYVITNSWGSSTEFFNWEDICNVNIPVPDLSIQKSIADIFSVYNQRKKIAEKMRENIKSICPVLIQGAIREAMRS